MANATIIDFGAWAEDDFSGKCSRSGVTRNRSSQDRTGWDYFVEFPPIQSPSLPADLQPPASSARVQVKSKRKGKAFVDLKLSNAQHFAKDPLPCFLVLYQATNGTEPIRIYARHFWTEEIDAALRRAREADREGRQDLNRLTLRVSFTDADDRTGDLIAWMRSILSQHHRYVEEKLALVRSLGFGQGAIHGTIRFSLEDLQDLIDHQVGLRAEPPPIELTVTQRRFGIDQKVPLFSGRPDLMYLRSHPEPARVRIRAPIGADIWLDGELFRPGIEAPIDMMKLRVVADFLEIVLTGTKAGAMTLNLEPGRRRGLASFRSLVATLHLAAAGPLNLLVTSPDMPNLPASVELAGIEEDAALQQFAKVIDCLDKASAGILPADFAVSQDEIDTAWNGIVDFNGMVTGTDFKGSFELMEALGHDLPTPPAVFFYDWVEIGDWVVGAVVRRPVQSFELVGASGRVELGPARVMEAFVRRTHGTDVLGELQALYRQARHMEKDSSFEMFAGCYRAMLRMSGIKAVSKAAV